MVMREEGSGSCEELDDALRGLHAFVGFGHQRHADAAAARVDAVRLARQQLPGSTVTLY